MAHIETFIQSAWQHLRADRHKQAMESAKKAHAISPNSPDVAHLLGILASRDGKPEIALPLLQKAIDTGGKTAHRLRHIAEALLDAGYPEAALTPLNDAITQFGASSDLLGLKSAIEIAVEQWSNAANSAQAAIDINPSLMAWELNLSFAQLIQGNIAEGFKNATARPDNLNLGSFCPVFQHTKPCSIWLKGEQSVGALFYLRYVAPLVKQGWQFHLEADRKLVPLLQNSPLFLSVKEKNKCPQNELCINLGDLPLMALQCGITEIPPPLPLVPDSKLIEKYQQELAKLGPAPYVAVTWRGGPKGRKHRAGIRSLEKVIEPKLLGGLLSNTQGTVISLQRLPEADEALAFEQALGKKPADYSALNNNLAGMLALLSLVDEYFTVSNTNLHLREGLAKPSKVFINRPLQDWRWQAEGEQSIWYPNSAVYRQEKNKNWQAALTQLSQVQTNRDQAKKTTEAQAATSKLSTEALTNNNTDKHARLLNEGWAVVTNNIPEAIIKAQAVLQESPESPQALHLLGWAAVLDLKFEIAESVLQRATELAPTLGRIWGDYIRCLVLRGQCEKALKIGEDCLNNPNIKAKSFIHHALATAYNSLAEHKNALKQYDLCLAKSPNHLDALAYGGMLRMKLGEQAILGFKQFSARQDARLEAEYPIWVCPVLKGDISHLKILIMGDLGLGDELSCLRYLPYLVKTGAKISYWGGTKLMPLLDRLGFGIECLPNAERSPNINQFDIAFRVHELPCATEHFNAPDVAPPLALKTDASLVDKWRDWLSQQGPAPYIGFNWRAGASDTSSSAALKKLNKAVDANAFASALSGTKATFISLQRNVTKADLNAFEQALKAPVADAAGLADGLDDMLALQSLLDENIGVSNTNMHLRAGLGKGSRVLVQTPYGDWRWGVEGSESPWFKDCTVYRQNKQAEWGEALKTLQQDLHALYGVQSAPAPMPLKQTQTIKTASSNSKTKRLIWLTAGIIKTVNSEKISDLASARYRVITPLEALTTHGWQSEIVNEGTSLTMGGWGSATPQTGDTLIISKVFTEHSVKLAKDAKSRGAAVVLDLCDNFLDHPKRGPLQKALLSVTDHVVTSTQAINEALTAVGKKADSVISDPVEFKRGEIKFAPDKVLKLVWFGHAVNIDTLAQSLPALAKLAQTTPLQLNVVTTLPNGQQDLDKITPKGLTATYTPWSVSATEEAIANCDIVIIPTLQSDIKNAKSPNRLLEPLWAGRMVVAGRLPAYLHFADSAWVGKDLNEGIQWCLANPKEVKARIAQGQADVEKYFTQEAIGQQWDNLLQSIQKQPSTEPIADNVVIKSPLQKRTSVAILSTQMPIFPSIGIRLIEPFSLLQDKISPKLAVKINNQRMDIDESVLSESEVIIVQRDFPSEGTIPLLKRYKSKGKTIIYETDDAFHLLDGNHSKSHCLEYVPWINECIELADIVTVSTPELQKEFPHANKVLCVPNKLSPTLWTSELYERACQVKKACTENTIRIGIIAGRNHDKDCLLLAEVIQKINKSNSNIIWVGYGDAATELLEVVPTNKKQTFESKWNYRNHPLRLAELGLDILLAPLEDSSFNRCISNLKFIESGFLAIPCIMSDLPAFNKSVQNDKNGILVQNNPSDWINAIQTLIDNPSLRESIGNSARETVLNSFMLNQDSEWLNILQKPDLVKSSSRFRVYPIQQNKFKSTIGLLTTQGSSLPSISIRVIKPLEEIGIKPIVVARYTDTLEVDYASIFHINTFVVHRDFPTELSMPLLKKLKAMGKKLVYETDDAFHLIPEHHSKAFHRAKAPSIFEFAKIADAISVSTNKLADEFKPYGEVSVLANRLSAKLWNDSLIGTTKQNKAKHNAENIRIGIVGGTDHQFDLALLTDAIKTIAKNNTNIHWVAYGDGAVDILKPLVTENKLSIVKTNYDYLSHPTRLAEMALDIALVPLVDDSFNRCRSNLKFLEFGFLGVATVFSNVESYNKTVIDGKTGLLVNNTTESWADAIQKLIDSQVLREKLGSKAQNEIQKNWMINSKNNGWKELLEKLV